MHSYLDEYGSTAAIVCEHIHAQHCAIRSAFKSEPCVAEDSGWAFFCGDYEVENPDLAKIWLLSEVIAHEP